MSVSDRTPQHADHDVFLVAQLAADDLRPSERPVALELVANCHACATLLADLRAIASATTALPPVPAAAARPRDFRLTEEDAARLRRGSWRRWFGVARSPRLSFTQPLGVGLTTLGLVGMLISGGSFGFAAGGSAPAAAPQTAGGGAAVREVPSDDTDGSEFTTRVSADGSPTVAPAAGASPMAAPVPSVAGQAPQGPGVSPQVETVVESPAPDDDSSKLGDSAPAGGDDGSAGGAPADSIPADGTPPVATTSVDAPATWAGAGWIALIVAGVALFLLRPVAGRLANRR